MNLKLSQCSDRLREIAARHGVEHLGIARSRAVEHQAAEQYRRWLAEGGHAAMDYLNRYDDLRADPRLLLPGAASIICCAVNYYHDTPNASDGPEIALYAQGDDYHEVVRSMLEAIAAEIREIWGGETRVCVDTAPIRERYWAMKSGLGFIGRNNHLIIPGHGSYYFLGEIITTTRFEPDSPINVNCGSCRLCIDACPGHALTDNGPVDARRCLSYLTIEHRGPLPEGTDLGNHLYGCDECQRVCPHNRHATPTAIKRLQPRRQVVTLTADDVAQMTQPQFSTIFSHSAIKRTKLAGLQRNLAAMSGDADDE